jgi:hypothetical protein
MNRGFREPTETKQDNNKLQHPVAHGLLENV